MTKEAGSGQMVRALDWKGAFWVAAGVPPLVLFSIGGIAGVAGKAAFVMHWKSLRRQIRVRGEVEVVSDAEADEYYQSRPLGSRIGAWASLQSQPLDSRATLLKRVAIDYQSRRIQPSA